MATAEDHKLAADLAESTGALLIETRRSLLAENKEIAEIKDLGDATAHKHLMERLGELRPDDAVLSEEASADERHDSTRLTAPRVWIIDPVDGTREYGEARDDWAVHVALVEGGAPTAGAVALPGAGLVLSTGEPPTAPAPASQLRIVVSRTRPPAEAQRVAEALDAELIPMGSAGAKAMAVVRGMADIYIHSGGQFEWDSAAPVAVARAAGLFCSRIDGSELRYNRVDTYLPDLLICHPENAEKILDAIN